MHGRSVDVDNGFGGNRRGGQGPAPESLVERILNVPNGPSAPVHRHRSGIGRRDDAKAAVTIVGDRPALGRVYLDALELERPREAHSSLERLSRSGDGDRLVGSKRREEAARLVPRLNQELEVNAQGLCDRRLEEPLATTAGRRIGLLTRDAQPARQRLRGSGGVLG